MNCPYYEDFTRNCIEKYSSVMKYQNFSYCKEFEYDKCPIFKIIQSDYACKYLNECIETFLNESPDFYRKLFSEDKVNKLIVKLMDKYCLSKSNSIECERYKRYERGEKPSYKIFSDGKIPYLKIILGR